jgi:hypothetical protein
MQYGRNYGASYQEVTEEVIVERMKPFTLDRMIHWKFERAYKQLHPPCFVATMKQGRILGKNGTVVAPDDTLIRDVSRESVDMTIPHTASLSLKLGKHTKVKHTVAVLSTVWSYVYYHWMLDIIPRVELLRKAGLLEKVDYFVIPDDHLPFQKSVLNKLGIGIDKIIIADDEKKLHLEVSELIIPSLPSTLDSPMGWACQFIRDTFKDCMMPMPSPKKRLYISRAKSLGRKIINEEEVLSLLGPMGFEIIELELLSVDDQVRLFSAAECVVAPHGAGLTNILFCSANTVILDIFAPKYINPCYWIIANELDLNYSYLIGKGEQPREGVDLDQKLDDIIVPVDQMKKILKYQGIH